MKMPGSHRCTGMDSTRVLTTSDRVQTLREHVRSVRADIERRGILVDAEMERCLVDMMRAGREAIEGGGMASDDPKYKAAAVRLHKLARDREQRGVVPQVRNTNFPRHQTRTDQVNRTLERRGRIPGNVVHLVDLANRGARSEREFLRFLTEIERFLRTG